MEWTPERIKLLQELWLSGLSASQCAHKLGCTRNAVIGKVSRMGMTGRKQPSKPVYRPRKPREPASTTIREVIYVGNHQCKWPIGDPLEPDFAFCGKPAEKSYCAYHHAIAYRKPPERLERLGRLY